MREVVGMKSGLTGEAEFDLGIQELKGHPKRLEYDLRIFATFSCMFKAMFVQSFFDLALDALAD